MKRFLTIITVSIASQFIYAQKNISPFNSLKVYDKIPVELIQSEDYKVDITGKDANNVELVNSGSELKIRMTTTKILQGSDIKIILYYRDINKIQASQGSQITSNATIEATKLELVSNEGSLINLPIKTSSLDVKTNTGGVIELTGSTNSQNVVVSTGGRYKAQNLNTEITDVTTNAGGEAQVNVTNTLTAKTRAGGIIDVYGNPETRNEKKVIGGKINYK